MNLEFITHELCSKLSDSAFDSKLLQYCLYKRLTSFFVLAVVETEIQYEVIPYTFVSDIVI